LFVGAQRQLSGSNERGGRVAGHRENSAKGVPLQNPLKLAEIHKVRT
jgi:hypothetical protein